MGGRTAQSQQRPQASTAPTQFRTYRNASMHAEIVRTRTGLSGAPASPRTPARKCESPLSGGLQVSARADGGTRTRDPFITSEVLYQLSYVGTVRNGRTEAA